jgi:hypothetical protein
VGPGVVGADIGLWEGVAVGFWVVGGSVGRPVGPREGLGEGFLVGGRMIVGGRLGLGIAVGDTEGGKIMG